jgi:type IV secretion system protein VirB3
MPAPETRPEGWELPVAQGLAEPIMLAGMPRDYAILMGTLALILGLGLRLWWLGIAWWTIAHAIGLYASRTDKRFFDVLRRHLARPGHLDA